MTIDRTRSETVPTLVPRIELDRAMVRVKEEIRQEFVANIDRMALERAIAGAEKAAAHAEKVAGELEGTRATSQRRWVKIIVVGGIILLLLLAAIGSLAAFAVENRARLDSLDRLLEIPRR